MEDSKLKEVSLELRALYLDKYQNPLSNQIQIKFYFAPKNQIKLDQISCIKRGCYIMLWLGPKSAENVETIFLV